jgi:hypothetical protein
MVLSTIRIKKLFFITALAVASLILINTNGFSQSGIDSVFSRLDPQRFAGAVSKQAAKLSNLMLKRGEKIIAKMQMQEQKHYQKMLHGKDSLVARARLTELKSEYGKLKTRIGQSSKGITKQYLPTLDSLHTALNFMKDNGAAKQITDAIAKTKELQDRFRQAEDIKKFIQERKELLKAELEKLGMLKQLKKMNKQVYYYAVRVNEYKELLKDPKKIEKKALQLLSETKLFQDFFRKNSIACVTVSDAWQSD